MHIILQGRATTSSVNEEALVIIARSGTLPQTLKFQRNVENLKSSSHQPTFPSHVSGYQYFPRRT